VAAAGAQSAIVTRTLAFKNNERVYQLYVPESANGHDAPLLVLLHGSGGSGSYLTNLWRGVAEREGIVLAAPNSLHPDGWRLREDAPEFIAAVVDAVRSANRIDARRIYLFGQSGGAVYALTLAMLESEYFAAVAIHAGAWRQAAERKLTALAARKIPIKLMVGDRDEFFTLASVHATEDALNAAGIPVAVDIIVGQHHWYEAKTAPQINDDAWTFLKPFALERPPRFIAYGH